MSKVVIFGIKDFAELAHYYLNVDSDHQVVAFTVDKEYITDNFFKGLPVIAFENLINIHPPDEIKIFAPISPLKMNSNRENIYNKIKENGYEFISYISSKAIIYNTTVGDNCFVFENNVIQPFTSIGNNTILWSGNHIGHHSNIGDHCFISSHVVVSGNVIIENNCFIGVNSTIIDNIVIKKFTYIGAGALIGNNTDEYGVYPGLKSLVSKVPSNRMRGY